MEMRWAEELMRQAKEIMLKGGELRFVVARRGNDRFPEIFTYPENKIACNKETLTD